MRQVFPPGFDLGVPRDPMEDIYEETTRQIDALAVGFNPRPVPPFDKLNGAAPFEKQNMSRSSRLPAPVKYTTKQAFYGLSPLDGPYRPAPTPSYMKIDPNEVLAKVLTETKQQMEEKQQQEDEHRRHLGEAYLVPLDPVKAAEAALSKLEHCQVEGKTFETFQSTLNEILDGESRPLRIDDEAEAAVVSKSTKPKKTVGRPPERSEQQQCIAPIPAAPSAPPSIESTSLMKENAKLQELVSFLQHYRQFQQNDPPPLMAERTAPLEEEESLVAAEKWKYHDVGTTPLHQPRSEGRFGFAPATSQSRTAGDVVELDLSHFDLAQLLNRDAEVRPFASRERVVSRSPQMVTGTARSPRKFHMEV